MLAGIYLSAQVLNVDLAGSNFQSLLPDRVEVFFLANVGREGDYFISFFLRDCQQENLMSLGASDLPASTLRYNSCLDRQNRRDRPSVSSSSSISFWISVSYVMTAKFVRMRKEEGGVFELSE